MAKPKSTIDGKSIAFSIREEDLTDLQELLSDLFARADKSREDGRIFMTSQYIYLIGIVQPEIRRIQNRFARESLASIRRETRELKAEARAEAAKVADNA